MVDHNPGGGHWFVAGLSPQVIILYRYKLTNLKLVLFVIFIVTLFVAFLTIWLVFLGLSAS